MKRIVKDANSEFSSHLVLRGMSQGAGYCWSELDGGLNVVIEPRISYRHGLLFNCALGVRSWRHQEVIDRILEGLAPGAIPVREGSDAIWYPYFSFGSDWYGFVDGIYKFIDLSEIESVRKMECAERADHIVDSVMPLLKPYSTVGSLSKIPVEAIYAGGPIDLALPLLAAFENQRDSLDRLLLRIEGYGSWLSPESYPVFSKRVMVYFEAGIFQKMLNLPSKEELASVQWPDFSAA